MNTVVTRWKLAETMARHRVGTKELADYLGVQPSSITDLKKALVLPRIGGERLDQLAAGITALSKTGGTVKGLDLLEDNPD